MSINDKKILLNARNHAIRREILNLLSRSNNAYSQLFSHFDISTGKLSYHLCIFEVSS